MKKRKFDDIKTVKYLTIIYTLCAIIWSINSYLKWTDGDRGIDLGLTVFCAILWIISSVLSIMRYHKLKQEGK